MLLLLACSPVGPVWLCVLDKWDERRNLALALFCFIAVAFGQPDGRCSQPAVKTGSCGFLTPTQTALVSALPSTEN